MALDFDGTNDRIDFASVFTTSGQALTISLWAWFDDSTPPANAYIFNSGITGGDTGTVFYQGSADSGQLVLSRVGTGTMRHRSSADVVTTGVWTHILAVSNGSMTAANNDIYVNGTEVTYAETTNGTGETTADQAWSLGGRAIDDIRNFDGRLAEMGVWNRALSTSEILRLAAAYSPLFITDGLRFYTPLSGRNTVFNRLGAASTTTVGTAYTEHPRIIYPSNSQIFGPSDAAAADAVPVCWAQYRRRRVA